MVIAAEGAYFSKLAAGMEGPLLQQEGAAMPKAGTSAPVAETTEKGLIANAYRSFRGLAQTSSCEVCDFAQQRTQRRAKDAHLCARYSLSKYTSKRSRA